MSTGPYVPPAIHVEYDLDTEAFQLMATSHGRTAIAGPRILRSPPHPDIRFSHETQARADKDAAILRAYLAECASGKRKETATVSIGADYWED